MKQEETSMKELYRVYNREILISGAVLLTILLGLFLIHVLRPQIVLTIPESGSIIFIDNERRGYTIRPNETQVFFVGPGVHSVLVARDDSWPWTKEILLSIGEKESLTTFNLPVSRKSTTIKKDDESYDRLMSLRDGLPQQEAISLDQMVAITTDGSRIVAEWKGNKKDTPSSFCFTETCLTSIQVINSETAIGDIAFMGKRRDVILFESAGNINAIELNREGTQNFQPIYVGADPEILEVTEEGVYLYDREAMRYINFLNERI